jgi:hypothetical protein
MKFDYKKYEILKKNYETIGSREHLDNLRSFLDESGCRMTKPLYTYLERKRYTWKYLDGIISTDPCTGEIKYKEILNPNYLYK